MHLEKTYPPTHSLCHNQLIFPLKNGAMKPMRRRRHGVKGPPFLILLGHQ